MVIVVNAAVLLQAEAAPPSMLTPRSYALSFNAAERETTG
jgi:hypothetical protein